MDNVDIIMDFRMYAKDPAKWHKRYQDNCRAYPKTWNRIKELQDGKKTEEQTLGKV